MLWLIVSMPINSMTVLAGVLQPCRASHSAGIAVSVPHQFRIYTIRKYPAPPQRRHILVQPFDVGHAAAEHDDIRVEEVNSLFNFGAAEVYAESH